MVVYCFKVALDHKKRIYRNIEILGSQTLDDFHHAIFSAFDRYDDHPYSFYLTRKATRSERTRFNSPEYTLMPSDSFQFRTGKKEHGTTNTKIATLLMKPKEKMYYLFDFGDQWWHEITLLSVVESNRMVTYPMITKRVGESPEQYPDFGDIEEG